MTQGAPVESSPKYMGVCGKVGWLATSGDTISFVCILAAGHDGPCGTKLTSQSGQYAQVTWGNLPTTTHEAPNLHVRCACWLHANAQFAVSSTEPGRSVSFWCELAEGHGGQHVRSHRLTGSNGQVSPPLFVTW